MRPRFDATRVATLVAATGFVLLVAFQFSLAVGVPAGRAAWGGSSAHLSMGLRIASALAVPFYGILTWFALARGGIVRAPIPRALLRRGPSIIAALLTVGTVMNFASRSPWERWTWGPVVLLLAACWVVIARSPLPDEGAAAEAE